MIGYVTVRKYLDSMEAQLDRARLEAEDIPARVVEPTSFNPLLTGAAGGVTLEVRAEDVARAESILAQPAAEPDETAEDPDDDAVRCPRCELPYCAFERPRVRGAAHPLAGVVALPFMILGPKRWRCDRCEHVWDDPKEGPKTMTRLLPGDPRPVFRLRRTHPGTGLFAGLMIGVLVGFGVAALAGGGLGLLAFVVTGIVGWTIGKAIGGDVCSEPKCREPLPPGAETCSGCRGSVAGRVHAAAEHYAAAADFRRELAEVRAKDEAREKRRKKKAARA